MSGHNRAPSVRCGSGLLGRGSDRVSYLGVLRLRAPAWPGRWPKPQKIARGLSAVEQDESPVALGQVGADRWWLGPVPAEDDREAAALHGWFMSPARCGGPIRMVPVLALVAVVMGFISWRTAAGTESIEERPSGLNGRPPGLAGP